MAINFPSSPSDGQKFVSGSVAYTYSSAMQTWKASAATALPFNYIVNGSMQTSQQNGTTAGTAAGYYPADQWVSSYGGAMVITAQSVVARTPFGSSQRTRYTVTTADAALATTDILLIYQRIEGTRLVAFGWGTAQAKPMVVRFGIKAPAGTYTFALRNGAFDRAYIAAFTISAGQANTDTYHTFAVPIPPSGTWATNTSLGLQFSINVAVGPTYIGVAGWQSENVYGVAGMTNGVATAGAVFEIFDVGMYLDPDGTGRAPPFEIVPDGKAMIDAMRFWCKTFSLQGWASSATTLGRARAMHPVEMRASPTTAVVGTPTVYDGTANNVIGAPSYVSNHRFCEFNAAATGLTAGRAAVVLCSSSAYYTNNARL